MTLYRWCVRPILFRIDPERIHHATLAACRALGRFDFARNVSRKLHAFDDPRLRSTVAGIDFPNPVGLPGGFDKNGLAVDMLATAGFGFIEVGSVSAHPSAGNPERPRLFRLPADESLMVYYGVPNEGAEVIARRLAPVRLSVPLGVNVVETNTGVLAKPESVIEEMTAAIAPFLEIADYLVANMNCPNSAGGASPFDDLRNLGLLLENFRRYERLPPVFLKIPVACDPAAIDAVLAVADPFPFVKGFIPNVGAQKPYTGLKTPKEQLERMPGSLTGPSTRERANHAIRTWHARIDRSRHALISAGGIFSAEDAYERIRSGASLVQVYTALIYRGPGLVKRINQGLCRLLDRDGLRNISEAVGADAPTRKPDRMVAPASTLPSSLISTP